MGERTEIAWTTHSFNGVLGCVEYSKGCTNCYARTFVTNRMGKYLWGPAKTTPRQITTDANWRKPVKWNQDAIDAGERHKVFAYSMADWAEDHPMVAEVRPRLFRLIRTTPGLDWLLLTKRAENIAGMLPNDWGPGYPNCWLGTSIEDMDAAWRADELRKVQAAVRFVSYEPALGPLDDMPLDGIDWLIEGAESGGKRRPYNADWARSIRDRCAAAGVTFFRKQGPAFKPGQFPELDGVLHYNFPTPRPLSWDDCQSAA
jgi:protein gp37